MTEARVIKILSTGRPYQVLDQRQGHSPIVQGFLFKCNFCTVFQQLTRFQQTERRARRAVPLRQMSHLFFCNKSEYQCIQYPCIALILHVCCLIMVALWNRADHYIFILSFVLSSSSFFPPQIGCVPYFHTWCGLSANLRCRSETCCTRLAENTGRKKVAKNRHLGTIAQLCRAISL